jgi:hypothetical protein
MGIHLIDRSLPRRHDARIDLGIANAESLILNANEDSVRGGGMSPIDEPVSSEPTPPPPKARKPKTEPAPGVDLVAFTVDAANGRIIKVEGVDAAGAHRELSREERTRLVETAAKATLERVIEQAFEAGIDCALGAEADEEETAESDGDAELSRLLLRSLMERSAARRLMRSEVLSRAIVGTLIEQAAALRVSPPEGAATH